MPGLDAQERLVLDAMKNNRVPAAGLVRVVRTAADATALSSDEIFSDNGGGVVL